MAEIAVERGWMTLTKYLDIIVSFDSMKMRGSMVLSTEKKTGNRERRFSAIFP